MLRHMAANTTIKEPLLIDFIFKKARRLDFKKSPPFLVLRYEKRFRNLLRILEKKINGERGDLHRTN